MSKQVTQIIEENKKDFFRYFNKVCSSKNKLMVYGNLKEILDDFKRKIRRRVIMMLLALLSKK